MLKRFVNTISLVVSIVALSASLACAATITNGFTYTVADVFITGAVGVGTHFHSNTGGAFGNPAGLAEVGRLSSEEVRGLSEYDLTGLSASTSAYVTFDVYQMNGLFGQSPFSGDINIYGYQGNNLEDLSDFQATALGLVGSFSTAGLALNDVLSFDISSIFNSAISNNYDSLGIRLQAVPLNQDNAAITFDDFRLTNTDDTTNPVPEPSTMLLLGGGLAGLAFWRKRKQA